jgi:hypothetical protein
LLFVTRSEARRESIDRLLEKEGFPTTGEYAARALTLDGAKQFLSRKLSASLSSPAREVRMAPRPPSVETRPQPRVGPVDCRDAVRPPPPPPPRPGFEGGPAICAAEERLRRGWVSVRGEHLIRLETEMKEVLWTLQIAREALRSRNGKPDEIPPLRREAVSILKYFSLYARHAGSALARYDLQIAEGSPHELL